MRKSGPSLAPLQSAIGMMEYWSNEILSSEKRNNVVYWQNSITEKLMVSFKTV